MMTVQNITKENFEAEVHFEASLLGLVGF